MINNANLTGGGGTMINNQLLLIINTAMLLLIILSLKIKTYGKIFLNIFKMKVNIINKNNWNEDNNKLSNDTKYIELDFIFQINNNKNSNNNIYNLDIYKKKKLKYELIENHYLNLASTMKSASGATTYEKLKYINLLPYEIKEFKIKIKLTKEEFENITKEPIYIKYKTKRRNKKLKLNKYLKKTK